MRVCKSRDGFPNIYETEVSTKLRTEGIIYNMLRVVATRVTRMPVSPAAWSSSSSTSFFDGGVGGGEEAGDCGGGGRVVFADGVITVWQLTPSYPASHDVHMQLPVNPLTTPPLMQ